MKRNILFIMVLAIHFFAGAQVPQLVKNINAQDQGTGLTNDNAVMGSNFFFGSGKQLWKTDGTPAGTLLIKDFSSENAASIFRFVSSNNAVFFMVSLPNAYQLWKTDGTLNGTLLLKDFGLNQPLFYRAAVGNTVFFSCTESATGAEIWKSDGTVTGTSILKDINPGTASSNPQNFKNINGVLFFFATTSTGTGLWKSDGTETGTVLISDLDPVSNSFAQTGELTAMGSKAFFYFESAAAGREIWVSDGTAAGTFMLLDIATGTTGSFPNNFTAIGNKLCFVAQDALNRQVWITDGTTVGTVPLYDLVPNSRNDSYSYLTNCNGILYFSATSSFIATTEPYTSDGTTAGTRQLKDVNTGANGSDARGYRYFDGLTYFIASTPATGYELWSSDGTTAGTVLFTEIYPGTNNGIGGSFLIEAVVNNHLIFSGNHPNFREEPFSSDGTVAGTQLLKNIQTQGLGSYPKYITAIGNRLYLSGTLGFNDIEPWYSDGTATGTLQLKDLEPTGFSRPFEFTNIDNTSFYFRTFNQSSSRDIYKSDGTAGGTSKVVTGIQTEKMQLVNSTLYFSKSDGANGAELWKYESDVASLVKNINPASNSSFPSNLTAFNNQLYFFANDGINGNELWKSDGTNAGTQLVADINPGIAASGTNQKMVVFNNNLYLLTIKSNLLSLVKTDGTTTGTTVVKSFTANDEAGRLFVFDNAVYFIKKNVNGSQANEELWKTDGSEAGTVLVKEILPFTTIDADYVQNISFFVNGNRFYFYVDQEDLFGETVKFTLWASDGTTVGTVAVKTYQFPSGSDPTIDNELNYIAAYDNSQVLFVFADDASGLEIWKTNGTVAGTSLVSDLNPGAAGSDPSDLINFNNAIYFAANDGTDLNELWKINAGSTLPLKLLSFTAYKQHKKVQLQWRTANEINTSHFEIERSTNGRNFSVIGSIEASQRTANNYAAMDDLPFNGTNYYRLKMIDKDATFTFSQIIKIHFAESDDVIVQPNPATDFIVVANAEPYKVLRLVDINGKEVKRFEKNASNRYSIVGVAKGVYLLQLYKEGIVAVKKIIIE